MLEPWNDAALLPPPVHTFSCSRVEGIHELRSTCKSIIKVLSNQSPLHKESAILSRIAYKFDKKFRNDIGYKNFKKVNVALRRYLGLNLLKDIESFSNTLPPVAEEVYLPTRQMLEYVLIRLVTFSKIMLRICVCSKKASVLYLHRIKCGESYWMSLMPYAVLSRVWSMSLVLLRHACCWYLQLLPWVEKLKVKGVAFLPNNYKLPLNLEDWLDLNNIDNFGRFEWAPDKCLAVQSTLIEDEDGDDLDSILDYINRLNDDDNSEELLVAPHQNKLNYTQLIPINQTKQFQNIDQGESISRESFKTHLWTTKTEPEVKIKNTYIHSPANVTNTETLQEFITKEEAFRNENNDISLTNHLSFMQWQALKKSLSALLDTLSNNRKIEKKFQKIWKQKCIDYS